MTGVGALVDRRRRHHEVSILIVAAARVGRCFGSQPRAKVSMMNMLRRSRCTDVAACGVDRLPEPRASRAVRSGPARRATRAPWRYWRRDWRWRTTPPRGRGRYPQPPGPDGTWPRLVRPSALQQRGDGILTHGQLVSRVRLTRPRSSRQGSPPAIDNL
jgi:hypothetical protein